MSVRVYSGPHADRRHGPGPVLRSLPWAFATLTIVGQIAWILAAGDVRTALTIATVVTFFLASAFHAAISRGVPWAAGYLVIAMGVGFLAEALGTRTQLPFGDYAYTDALGLAVLGVPVVVPMAWAMMAYPCLLAARRLFRSPVAVPLAAAWLLASWDLFLDPQMTGESYWVWNVGEPSLPGIPGIPLQNYAGWLLVSLVIMVLMDRLPRYRSDDGVPTLMLLWTYVGGIVANLVFLGRPWVALWGGLGMGLLVVPWAWRVWTSRP